LVLDRIIALVLLALAGLFYSLTYLYPPETMSFPRFLLVIFGILSVFLLLFPGKKKEYAFEELFASEKVITFVGALVYVSLIHLLGFFVSSFLFSFLYVWRFERNAPVKAAGVAFAFAGITYLVFVIFLSLTFPQGLLI
jgi:hypothetical protein